MREVGFDGLIIYIFIFFSGQNYDLFFLEFIGFYKYGYL